MGSLGRDWRCCVLSGSRGITRPRQGIVVFIRDCVVSLRRTQWSSVSFRVAWVYSFALRVPRVDSGSRGFTRACLGVVEFMRDGVDSHGRTNNSFRFTCVYLGSPIDRRVNSGSPGFIYARLEGRRID